MYAAQLNTVISVITFALPLLGAYFVLMHLVRTHTDDVKERFPTASVDMLCKVKRRIGCIAIVASLMVVAFSTTVGMDLALLLNDRTLFYGKPLTSYIMEL